MKQQIPHNIIISRTDSIGDVVLTLPVAAVLKKHFPHIHIGFMGSAYTRPVIEACENVDQFIDVKDFMNKPVLINGEKPQSILHVFPVLALANRAKKLNIPLRIGTTNRIYHWMTCNSLVRLSRKNSTLHEAQLNIKLLEPFGIEGNYSKEAISGLFALNHLQALPSSFASLINENKYNLILHPKSQGSAREWGLDNFLALIKSLDPERYQIFISGTEKEQSILKPFFENSGKHVKDISGQMNLGQFMAFVAACDGLVANSTGPLHIAGALGKDAFGIYPPMHPIHPERWAPLGPRAKVFVLDRSCTDCKSGKNACHCIMDVQPQWIKTALDSLSMYNLKGI